MAQVTGAGDFSAGPVLAIEPGEKDGKVRIAMLHRKDAEDALYDDLKHHAADAHYDPLDVMRALIRESGIDQGRITEIFNEEVPAAAPA